MLDTPRKLSLRLTLVLATCMACSAGAKETVSGSPVEEAPPLDASISQDDAAISAPDAMAEPPPPPPLDAGPPPDPEACRKLAALVRDFNASHPDFEKYTSDFEYKRLVADSLGSDNKPSYLPTGRTPVTTGPSEFAQWYRATAGVNIEVPVELRLVEESKGLYVYDSEAFFPVDGAGFNEVTQGHNFLFTTEIHTSFTYHGGEKFTFTGDDDLWLFINRKLAIDLGGTHPELKGEIDLDAEFVRFGLERGKSYPMDIFHAERHTPGSHFRLETSIECFVPVSLI